MFYATIYMIDTITNSEILEEKQGSLPESDFNNNYVKWLNEIQQEDIEEKVRQKQWVNKLINNLFNDDNINMTKESIELETRETNEKIMTQATDIFYQNKKIENIKSIKGMIDYGLKQKREPTKILQILVESIHKKAPRINVDDKDNISFYCGNRALLMYQICEEYKDALGIRSCNMSLPYGHVMDIVTFNNGKVYIVDSSAGCFNEITNNFEEKQVGHWLTYKLKSNIKCFQDQPNAAIYTYTFFPVADKIGWKQFSFISSRINSFSYYAIQKFYDAAQKTAWYEQTHTIEELKLFIEKEIYTKEKPYDGILTPDDILINYPKQDQIKMIEWHLYNAKSKEENQKYLDTYKSIIRDISNDYPDYSWEKEENNLLEKYRLVDGGIFKASITPSDVQEIISFCRAKNINGAQLLKMCLNFIINPQKQEPIISLDEKLDKKFKEYLLAKNAQANAWSSSIEKELDEQIKVLQI